MHAETPYGRAYERARAAVRNFALGGLALAWLVSAAVNHKGYGGGAWQPFAQEPLGLREELEWVVWLLVVVLAVDAVDLFVVALFWRSRASREPGRIARLWLLLSAVAVAVGIAYTLKYAAGRLIVRQRQPPHSSPSSPPARTPFTRTPSPVARN